MKKYFSGLMVFAVICGFSGLAQAEDKNLIQNVAEGTGQVVAGTVEATGNVMEGTGEMIAGTPDATKNVVEGSGQVVAATAGATSNVVKGTGEVLDHVGKTVSGQNFTSGNKKK